MVGLVPAIHVFVSEKRKTWMPGSRLRQGFAGRQHRSAAEALAKAASPGMTNFEHR